jgi:hypothetical protein
MAESTSRSPHKLEYTSCIKTTMPSPTAVTTYHSSFDFISEPRDCDTLGIRNQDINHNNHRLALERDLRRLDIDSDQRIIPTKTRKLDRSESISLPTTPTEQLSPSYPYKYPHLVALKKEIDNNNNDDDDDDDDDEQSFSYKSSTDYTPIEPEQDFQQQITDESISNSKK